MIDLRLLLLVVTFLALGLRAGGGQDEGARPEPEGRPAAALEVESELASEEESPELDLSVEDAEWETPAVPEDLQDPGFEPFVDLALLGEAISTQDASLAADVALQLAEGERCLSRPHKALPAEAVLKTAARLAEYMRHQQTLERLHRHAEQQDNKELAQQLSAASKLIASERSADPGATVSVETTTSEEFAAYQGLLDEVRTAAVIQDSETLTQLQEALVHITWLSDSQRQFLQTRISQSVRSADAVDPQTQQALKSLAEASRTSPRWPRIPRIPRVPKPPLPTKPPRVLGPIPRVPRYDRLEGGEERIRQNLRRFLGGRLRGAEEPDHHTSGCCGEPLPQDPSPEVATISTTEMLQAAPPPQLDDPSFRPFIDLGTLRHALSNADSTLLADVAIQLAEAEDHLGRQHRLLSSSFLLERAAHLAAVSSDIASMRRLASAADRLQLKSASESINTQLRLTGQARDAHASPFDLELSSTSPVALAIYSDVTKDVRRAIATGAPETLEVIVTIVPELPVLSACQRDQLRQMVVAARTRIPQQTSDDSRILAKLAGSSRGACGSGRNERWVRDSYGNADFTGACRAHDACYDRCSASQRECDDQFERDLRQACTRAYGSWAHRFQREGCLGLASKYALAVRRAGGDAYRNAQRAACGGSGGNGNVAESTSRCSRCHGARRIIVRSGFRVRSRTCPVCGGTGRR